MHKEIHNCISGFKKSYLTNSVCYEQSETIPELSNSYSTNEWFTLERKLRKNIQLTGHTLEQQATQRLTVGPVETVALQIGALELEPQLIDPRRQ